MANSLAARRWWTIMPIVFITYSLAYLDRANYGFAAAAGIGCLLLAITGSHWWLGVVAVVLSGLVAVLLVLRCSQRFGGITGDVLGAGIELTLATLLIVGSAG